MLDYVLLVLLCVDIASVSAVLNLVFVASIGIIPYLLGIDLIDECYKIKCSKIFPHLSQITDCLATPLSDRLEEWRRTSNQMDRDSVKEIRKAKSELQRAMVEAEKCKKRIKRKVC